MAHWAAGGLTSCCRCPEGACSSEKGQHGLLEIAERRPVRLTKALRQIWAAFRYRPSQRKPAVPMFVIFSKAEALVSPTCLMRLAEQWQLATRVNPYSGHDIAVNAHLWLIDQLLYGALV